MLHQHALGSLHIPYLVPEIQTTNYPHGNAGYFTDPHHYFPHNSSTPLQPDPSSGWQSSYLNYPDFLPQQPFTATSSAQHPPPTPHPRVTPIDQDREWGIPSFYDPLSSPRLPVLCSSSTPCTPHTTNQPYIYLPPRFLTPPGLPRYASSISSDDILKPLSAGRPTNEHAPFPTPSYPSYSHHHQISQNISHHVSAPFGENLSGIVSSFSESHYHPIESLHRASIIASLPHEKKRKK